MGDAEQRKNWREKSAKWRAEHPGYNAAQGRKWRIEHPGYTKRWWTEHGSEYQRKWRAEHPGYALAKTKEWQSKSIAQCLFTTVKLRARKRKNSFSLTLTWIKEKLAVGVCEQTGKPFTFERGGGDLLNSNRNPWFPSIDRIDSSLGYTEANCQMVCTIYNLAKADWADADVLEMAKWLIKTSKRKT